MDSGLNINHVDFESGRLSVCGANFVPSFAEEQDLWVGAGLHGTRVTATVAGHRRCRAALRRNGPIGAAHPVRKGSKHAWFRLRYLHLRGHRLSGAALVVRSVRWTDDAVAPPIVKLSLSGTSRVWEERDAAARKLDAVVWDTGQLYVVANSNADVHGFSNFGAAKNSLPVGAAWDSGELAGFSSHGPTADGRLVPLVVGTGVQVHSALGDGSRGGYWSSNGTSMSSPAVAGADVIANTVLNDLDSSSSRPCGYHSECRR